jgi:anti-sigma factor RsiW
MTQTPQSASAGEHLEPDTLSAFIDGELSSEVRQGVERHLATCHPCTLRVLSAMQLKAATARAGNRYAPSPEALARLTANLRAQKKPEQPETKQTARVYTMRSPRYAAWSALAAAVLLAVTFLGWHQLHQTNALSAELLDQHLATLSSAAAPQVISTDRHTVKPWFQGRIPFSFNLPEATSLPPDTTLQGADLVYIDHQPAALLLFTIHKHQVSVFLTQRDTASALISPSNIRAGFNLHSATTPDLRIVAVSDVNPAELDSLLAVLVQAQKPLG